MMNREEDQNNDINVIDVVEAQKAVKAEETQKSQNSETNSQINLSHQICDFAKITNSDLTGRLKILKNQEAKILGEILNHIAEIDRRRLFLEMGFPSLFEFLVREIGYSNARAQRRIDAARLMRQVPELSAKIANGSVNLTQVSKVQQAIRDIKKSTGQIVAVEAKRDLIAKIENQTAQKTEVIIAQTFDIQPLTEERIFEKNRFQKMKFQKDDSVRLEITLTHSQMAKIQEARALLSNSLPGATLAELFTYLAEKVVKSKTQAQEKGKRKEWREHGENAKVYFRSKVDTIGLNITKVKMGLECRQARPLATRERKLVFTRDSSCQYVSPKSGLKCGSKYFLHIDHINQRLFGGLNTPENLRLLCSNHHQLRHSESK